MPSRPGSFRIAIDLDRPDGSYYPDDEVKGTITIESPKEVVLHEIVAGLVFSQEYQLKATSAHNTPPKWDKAQHWYHKEVLAIDKVPAKFKETFPFTWRIPPDASPPCSGKVIRNRWLALVQVDRTMARDVVTEVELPLVVPPHGSIGGGEFSDQKVPVPAFMSFSLPKLDYIEGDTITGELNIGVHDDEIDVRGIRVELVRREHVSMDGGKTRLIVEQRVQLGGRTTLQAKKPELYEFKLQVATNGCPTNVTTTGEVTWMLRGVLDRPQSKDATVQQEVYLYNGPARV